MPTPQAFRAKALLSNIRLHPIKSLDPVAVQEAKIGPNGGLENDRVWALFSVDGKWVNGKANPAIHLIRATYNPELTQVTLSVPTDRRGIPAMTMDFPGDTERAGKWFSVFFQQLVTVRYSRDGYPDDGLASGPTIVSTPSLRRVMEWFPGLTLEETRERFRATLEMDGDSADPLPAFWEDGLFADDPNYSVRFRVGEVAFEGSNPCARCPVPPRNPRTGEEWIGFQKRYVEMRRAELPPWAPAERFDHFYRLSTNTRVASSELGKTLRIGDPVTF